MNMVTIQQLDLPAFGELTGILAHLRPVEGRSYAMAMARKSCRLLRVDTAGVLEDDAGEPVSVDECYEIVVFTADWQLVAIREGAGARLELITDTETTLPDGNEPCGCEAARIERTYLMWGKVRSPESNGWCELSDERIGSFRVPAPGGTAEGMRLGLEAVEYFCRLEHGNAGVVRQRLTGIELRRDASGRADSEGKGESG